MKGKLYLLVALVITAVVTGGSYAHTYTTLSATISVTDAEANIATIEEAVSQPDWEDILIPVEETETIRPDAAGTYTECDPVGDTSNYLCVDEEVADGDSTYVQTTGNVTELDTYNTDNHSEGKGTVTSVKVYARCKGTVSADTHAAEVAIRTNDADYFGGTTLLPTSYTDLSHTWTYNPNTESEWTWDEIDALQAGVRQYDQGDGDVRCTQVYVEVTYEYIPLTGNVPTGDLFEVIPDADYTDDLGVKVYLVNTDNLTKAYQSLNMELYLEGSVEAGKTPNYRLLTLNNGVASFTIEDGGSDNHTLSVTGGDYCLVSDNISAWEEGWTVIPELYCEATQR